MSSPTERSGREGFALLEALVALAIIGTFAIAVLATLGAQVRTADQAARLLIAEALAEDRHIALELLAVPDLEDLPDTLAAGIFPAPFDVYSWVATATPVEDEDGLYATEVVVTDGSFSLPLRGMIHRVSTFETVAATPAGQGEP